MRPAAWQQNDAPSSLAAEEQPLEVDIHHPVPVRFGDIDCGMVGTQPGIIHQNIQPTVMVAGGLHDRADLRDVQHIELQGQRLTPLSPDFRCQLFQHG